MTTTPYNDPADDPNFDWDAYDREHEADDDGDFLDWLYNEIEREARD